MLLHADDFRGYGGSSSRMTNGVYAAVGTGIIAADPDVNAISGSKAFREGIGSLENWRWAMPASHATVGVAQRVWCGNLPDTTSSAPKPVSMRNSGNVAICDLRIDTNGVLQVLNSAGTQIAATSGPVITANAWWHIEMKVIIADTASSIEVRVEGVTVINESATLSLGTTPIAQVSSRNSNGAPPTWYSKDVVVWDGSGTSVNDFVGAVIVYELLTTSDVSLNWDTTGANGYSVLDNDPPLDSTAYISATYPAMPAAAEFGLTDLPADVTSVIGLITRVRAAKSDGGDGQLQVSLTSGGSDDNGNDRPITTAQTYWSDVSVLDPDTSAAWTPVAVNAATLKLDRTL